MTFPINVNVPNAPNNPADDQPIMKQNYGNIAGFLAVDHVAPGVVNDGIHKQVRMTNQSIAGAVFAPGSGVLFAGLGNGQSWPYWKNAAGTFPLMGSTLAPTANGSAVLPGGIRLQWGNGTALANQASSIIVFPTAFSSTAFSVTANISNLSSSGNRSLYIFTVSATQFDVRSTSSTNQTFYWMAIGPA